MRARFKYNLSSLIMCSLSLIWQKRTVYPGMLFFPESIGNFFCIRMCFLKIFWKKILFRFILILSIFKLSCLICCCPSLKGEVFTPLEKAALIIRSFQNSQCPLESYGCYWNEIFILWLATFSSIHRTNLKFTRWFDGIDAPIDSSYIFNQSNEVRSLC